MKCSYSNFLRKIPIGPKAIANFTLHPASCTKAIQMVILDSPNSGHALCTVGATTEY